jgi:hypothetical protein
MSDIQGPRYKFSQEGLDDITSRIKELHNELRTGQISYQDYKKNIKEATEQGRAATQEFSQLKGAIAASNPQLLEFSRTMSTFGSVANTVLSIQNAINLATIASSGITSDLAQTQAQAAEAYNEYVKDLHTYGPGDALTVSAYDKYIALTKQAKFEQDQLARQSFSTGITMVASAITAAGSISQVALTLQTVGKQYPGIASGMASVGAASLAILGPIAIVIAAIEGVNYAFGLLVPSFGEGTQRIADAIQNNWHVDALTARLLAPFVQFYAGVIDFTDESYNQLVIMYNSIIDNIINPLIKTWDNTLGQITGKIATVGDAAKIDMSHNNEKILQSIGLGPASASAASANPDSVNQFLLTGQMGGSQIQPQIGQIAQNSTLALAQSQQQGDRTSSLLGTLNGTFQTGNSALATINNAIPTASANQIAATNAVKDATTSMSTAIQNAIKDNTIAITEQFTNQANASISALNSIKDQIANQPAAIAQAQKNYDAANQNLQAVMNSHMAEMNANPGITGSDFPDIMAAIKTVQDTQTALDTTKAKTAQLQAQGQAILANTTSSGILDVGNVGLEPVLSSLGLSSSSGIGSVIAGALGSYGTIGGAGMTAAQIAYFANTHDYGAFTQAAMHDSNPYGTTNGYGNAPSKQDQINAWMAATGIHDPNQASIALGYYSKTTTPTTGSPSNYGGSPYFNPLVPGYKPGQPVPTLGGFIAAASGFDGIVNSPIHFLAGEKGPEAISITPLSKGGGQGNTIHVHVNVAGSLHSTQSLKEFIDKTLKDTLRQVGFT